MTELSRDKKIFLVRTLIKDLVNNQNGNSQTLSFIDRDYITDDVLRLISAVSELIASKKTELDKAVASLVEAWASTVEEVAPKE